jgi:hypothetical protein
MGEPYLPRDILGAPLVRVPTGRASDADPQPTTFTGYLNSILNGDVWMSAAQAVDAPTSQAQRLPLPILDPALVRAANAIYEDLCGPTSLIRDVATKAGPVDMMGRPIKGLNVWDFVASLARDPLEVEKRRRMIDGLLEKAPNHPIARTTLKNRAIVWLSEAENAGLRSRYRLAEPGVAQVRKLVAMAKESILGWSADPEHCWSEYFVARLPGRRELGSATDVSSFTVDQRIQNYRERAEAEALRSSAQRAESPPTEQELLAAYREIVGCSRGVSESAPNDYWRCPNAPVPGRALYMPRLGGSIDLEDKRVYLIDGKLHLLEMVDGPTSFGYGFMMIRRKVQRWTRFDTPVRFK